MHVFGIVDTRDNWEKLRQRLHQTSEAIEQSKRLLQQTEELIKQSRGLESFRVKRPEARIEHSERPVTD